METDLRKTLKLQEDDATAVAELAACTAAYVLACTEALPAADPEAEAALDRAMVAKSSGARRKIKSAARLETK